MSVPHEGSEPSRHRGPVRAPQSLAGGLLLVALAVLALWLTRDLDQGTLNAMGPAMLPRWLAIPAIRLRQGKSDIFFRGASGLLIVSSDETNRAVTTPREDLAAACTYFEMLANAHGIATCWCGFLQLVQKEVPELLEKAAGLRRTTPFCAMLFGLPAVAYSRGVQRGDYAKVVYA